MTEHSSLSQLHQIELRFKQLSQLRLTRMLESYQPVQADAIELIPLLFHINHPSLPGFVDRETLAGFPNYTPPEKTLQSAKMLNRSFRLSTQNRPKSQLVGLFLMGSIGTLGQSFRSDLDLWICVEDDTNSKAREKLSEKASKITHWLNSKGVELHCYLVSPSQFQRRKFQTINKESCGDIQNLLLLDEFYRTSVWVAGKKPVWWLVAPESHYDQYLTRLKSDYQIDPRHWVDFGPVDAIPAREFFAATLWQLFKAIDSPYKSTLKLVVIEKYAREFPLVNLLSEAFKKSVYQSVFDNEKQFELTLDPYLILYQSIEDFLKESSDRLELIRQAFYLKVGIKLSIKSRKNGDWRYKIIHSLVSQWGWDHKKLIRLDSRVHWKIDQVIIERKKLFSLFNHCYHFIGSFARIQGVINQVDHEEVMALGRMLYATFDQRAHKLDKLNIGITPSTLESTIMIDQTALWQVYQNAKDDFASRQFSVYQSLSFFNALAWCVCNNIVDENTLINIRSKDSSYQDRIAHFAVKHLMQLKNQVSENNLTENFRAKSKILAIGVFFNTDKDPIAIIDGEKNYSLSQQIDIFCCGKSKINLIQQFDIFVINSWGEYENKNYSGQFAWLEFFIEYRQILLEQTENIHLFSLHLADTHFWRKRLLKLVYEWNQCIIDARSSHKVNRFLMRSGRNWQRIDFIDRQVDYDSKRSQKLLLKSFSHTRHHSIRYLLDENFILPKKLKQFITRTSPTAYRCFVDESSKPELQIYIQGKCGNIYYQTHRNVTSEQLIKRYLPFFENGLQDAGRFSLNVSDVTFEILSKDSVNSRKLKPAADHLFKDNVIQSIIAIAQYTSDRKRICYDFVFQGRQLSYIKWGEGVYQVLAHQVIKMRMDNQPYPVLVTGVDLAAVDPHATLFDQLNHKRIIEQKIAKALSELRYTPPS